MKIDDEVFVIVLPHHKENLSRLWMIKELHTDILLLTLGADSSLEHNQSLYFSHEGEMPVGGYRCCRPDRLRRRFLLRESAQQADSAEGLII